MPGFPLGPGTVFIGNSVFIPTPGLEPERANQIEIGGRYARHDLVWDGDRLSFAANAYYAKVDEFVDTIVHFIDFSTGSFNAVTGNFEVNGSTRNVNVNAALWGVEAEVDYDTGDWFAGAGLTIPRGRNVGGGPLGSIPQDRLTGPLAGATFAAGIDNLTDRTYRIHPNGLNQSGIAFKASASFQF